MLFQDALESVHRQLGPELQAFRGDCRAVRAGASDARSLPGDAVPAAGRGRRPTGAGSSRAPLRASGAGVWGRSWDGANANAWNAYLERLAASRASSSSSSGRRDGKFFVAGLRDSLAARSRAAGCRSEPACPPTRCRAWEPYQALAPTSWPRARAICLRPPPGVTLEYRDGVPHGERVGVPDRWIVDSERLAPAIAGVRRSTTRDSHPEAR